MNKLLPLTRALLICYSAGFIGSIFTTSAIPSWYQYLNKPVLSPPDWVFAPVWTLLYTLMGIALFRIEEKRRQAVRPETRSILTTLFIFYVHLIINAYWSIVFFGMKDIVSAFIIIAIMAGMILVLIVQFYRIDRLAGSLLVPYYVWVMFASFLNFSIWQLNK